MSEEEKAASIGRLMLEWKDSSEKLVAIEAEFMRHSEMLKSLSGLLARSRRVNTQSMLGSQALDDDLARLPAPEKLRQLVADAREELRRFEDLSAQRKSLGI